MIVCLEALDRKNRDAFRQVAGPGAAEVQAILSVNNAPTGETAFL
jgi:hypothetical protein